MRGRVEDRLAAPQPAFEPGGVLGRTSSASRCRTWRRSSCCHCSASGGGQVRRARARRPGRGVPRRSGQPRWSCRCRRRRRSAAGPCPDAAPSAAARAGRRGVRRELASERKGPAPERKPRRSVVRRRRVLDRESRSPGSGEANWPDRLARAPGGSGDLFVGASEGADEEVGSRGRTTHSRPRAGTSAPTSNAGSSVVVTASPSSLPRRTHSGNGLLPSPSRHRAR